MIETNRVTMRVEVDVDDEEILDAIEKIGGREKYSPQDETRTEIYIFERGAMRTIWCQRGR